MKKLLYIHGYNGSPDGSSCGLFKKYMKNWQVIGMDYFQDDCKVALEQIRQTINLEHIDLVAGSSLGGFLTLLTQGIERIVINPCYLPSVELPKLGPHNGLPAPSKSMIATYAQFEPVLKTFSEDERKLISGYFAREDDLIGDRYQEMYKREIGDFVFIPGGHHLSEEGAKIICSKY